MDTGTAKLIEWITFRLLVDFSDYLVTG